MSARVTAPVAGYSGTVVGVTFSNGVGQSDDDTALAYFQRHGYTIEETAPEPKATAKKATAK